MPLAVYTKVSLLLIDNVTHNLQCNNSLYGDDASLLACVPYMQSKWIHARVYTQAANKISMTVKVWVLQAITVIVFEFCIWKQAFLLEIVDDLYCTADQLNHSDLECTS